jgi:hypothetical protein
MAATAVLVTLVSACKPSGVPSDVAGDIPVTIENGVSAVLCMLQMTPAHGTPGENLMGGEPPLDTGGTKEVSVKAGSYTVEAAGCDSTFQGKKVITVSGPLTIHLIASKGGRAPSGQRPGSVNLEVNQIASNGPPGAGECLTAGECGAAEGQCCKGYHCVSPKPGEHPSCQPQ